ncbi:MAG: endolytic transglycosylase MltG [Candidatus Buchananbacteria bacterium]
MDMKKYLVISLVIFSLAGIFYFWYALQMPITKVSQEKLFVIKSGEGSWSTAKSLKTQGLIRSAIVLETYWWFYGLDTKVKPGEIKLDLNWNTIKIAKYLTGTTFITNEITVQLIEGWTNRQVVGYLKNKTNQALEFEKIMKEPGSQVIKHYDFFADKPAKASLEGYIFPDTYRLFADASAVEILQRILDNFDRQLNQDLRSEIKRQGKSIFEIITLASIVEKEVAQNTDRATVAGIFYKRLKIGMALQSDATINYITKKGTTRPSAADLSVNSLYNTYKHRGLPPGPICNPGLAAIKAAIYPKTTDYLYFLTTPTGEAVYSKTYEEHLANKHKYYP